MGLGGVTAVAVFVYYLNIPMIIVTLCYAAFCFVLVRSKALTATEMIWALADWLLSVIPVYVCGIGQTL